jgi:hypothetical protein
LLAKLRSQICQRAARRPAWKARSELPNLFEFATHNHRGAGTFSAEVRFSGFAFGDNIGAGVFGGTTPLVATWLIQSTGSLQAPSAYLIGSAAIMLVVCLRLRETFSLAVK